MLALPLRRLTALERQSLEQEAAELAATWVQYGTQYSLLYIQELPPSSVPCVHAVQPAVQPTVWSASQLRVLCSGESVVPRSSSSSLSCCKAKL